MLFFFLVFLNLVLKGGSMLLQLAEFQYNIVFREIVEEMDLLEL